MLAPISSDTGEYPTVRMQTGNAKKKWTKHRWVALVILLVTTAVFAVDIAVQTRHGWDELPGVAFDIFRAGWMFAVAAVLLAWAYDRIAPKIFARLAMLRELLRSIEETQDRTARHHSAEIDQLRSDMRACDAAQDRRMAQVLAAVEALSERAGERELAEYTEGFRDGLERANLHIPAPSPSPEPGRTVVSINGSRNHVR